MKFFFFCLFGYTFHTEGQAIEREKEIEEEEDGR